MEIKFIMHELNTFFCYFAYTNFINSDIKCPWCTSTVKMNSFYISP